MATAELLSFSASNVCPLDTSFLANHHSTMFLHTQAPQDDDHAEQLEQCVEWDDDGLQQQLLEKLNKTHNITPAQGGLSTTKGSSRQQAQRGLAGSSRQQALLPPAGLDRDSSPPPHTSQDTPRLGVHDLLDELLTQAQRTTADDNTAAQQQPARHGAHPQVDQHQVQQEQQGPSQGQLLGNQQHVSCLSGGAASVTSPYDEGSMRAPFVAT